MALGQRPRGEALDGLSLVAPRRLLEAGVHAELERAAGQAARDGEERLLPARVVCARRHVEVIGRHEAARELSPPDAAEPVRRALQGAAEPHVLDVADAAHAEAGQDACERLAEGAELVHVAVRVDVRDGHAAVAQERQLRLGLARDLLDWDPPEEGAAPHFARREEAAIRAEQAVEPGRVGERLVEPVGDECEVDAEAEVGAAARVLDGCVCGRHVRHDRGARQRALLEAFDRRADGLLRAAEVVGVHDDQHRLT